MRAIFFDVVHHGGKGDNLDSHVFSKPGLRAGLAAAGFGRVEFHGEPYFAHGVYWKQPSSLPLVARPG